jgi:uncharacterized protein YbjT (DUF2867 family)
MRIAIAGGTGWLGPFVVEAAHAAGHTTTVISRSNGIDLTTGAGLQDALRGVSAVIDVSNITTTSRKKSIAFFDAATKNLIDAGQRAGISHHVTLSIVGVDRVDFGYYAGKRRQEELVLTKSVPGSVLRATQFHEFAAQLQPVGLAEELAGPEQLEMSDMVRRLLQVRGSRRIVVPLPLPGAAGRQMAGGGLVPLGPGPRGHQTFEQWLTDAQGAESAGRPGR